MDTKRNILIAICLGLLLAAGCGERDPHAGHDHSSHADEGHEGHDISAHGQEEETRVSITPKGKRLAGIKLASVERMRIGNYLTLAGEVVYNEDRKAQVTPRYAGVAKEVKKHQGAWVESGEVLAVIEGNESFATYEVKAPLSGRIVEKNIVTGEFAEEGAALYVIANLATVWVHCEVFPADLEWVKVGQQVTIKAVSSDLETKGRISYIAPSLNRETRGAVARIVIGSKKGAWKPGMFVKGSIMATAGKKVPVVLKDAVQVLEDKKVVFSPKADREFVPMPVKTGRSNNRYVEITSGLKPGDRYVAKGAFELKAQIVTGSLDPHAGHGH